MPKKYPVELEARASQMAVQYNKSYEECLEIVIKQWEKEMRKKLDVSKSSTALY